MNFPDTLRYTKDHEWIKIDGEEAVVGITDFAQRELGDIVYVEVETVGQELKGGSVFGTVEAVKTVSDLYLPITGTITELNETINSSPELINNDPYGEGWIIKMKISDTVHLEGLLSAQEYQQLLS